MTEFLNAARRFLWALYRAWLEWAAAFLGGVAFVADDMIEGLPTIAEMLLYNQAMHVYALVRLLLAWAPSVPIPYPALGQVDGWWSLQQAHAPPAPLGPIGPGHGPHALEPSLAQNAAIHAPLAFPRWHANQMTGYNV